MNTIRPSDSSNYVSSIKASVEEKGVLTFAWQSIKALGEALAFAIGLMSLIGIPIIYYAYKPDRPPAISIPHQNALSDAVLVDLEKLLDDYIKNARQMISAKGNIGENVRAVWNHQLGIKITQRLKKESISHAELGILHPIFRDLMEVRLREQLSAETGKQREVILAYGYHEDDVDDVLNKFKKIEQTKF